MTTFIPRWPIATDETDRSPFVSDVSAIVERVDAEKSRASTQSMAPQDREGGGEDHDTAECVSDRADETDRSLRAIHSTPSRCLAPNACAVLGICGREDCVVADERATFSWHIAAARRPGNPHLVPDFYPNEESDDAA